MKKCKIMGCENDAKDMNAIWDHGEYCPYHVRQIEECADARRCEVTSNRLRGYNDDGSFTKTRLGGHPDYGREEK